MHSLLRVFRPPKAPWGPLDSGLMMRNESLLSFFLKDFKRTFGAILKGTSDITACQCVALLSTAWQCLALLSTSGLVSGGARGAMAPPKF